MLSDGTSPSKDMVVSTITPKCDNCGCVAVYVKMFGEDQICDNIDCIMEYIENEFEHLKKG